MSARNFHFLVCVRCWCPDVVGLLAGSSSGRSPLPVQFWHHILFWILFFSSHCHVLLCTSAPCYSLVDNCRFLSLFPRKGIMGKRTLCWSVADSALFQLRGLVSMTCQSVQNPFGLMQCTVSLYPRYCANLMILTAIADCIIVILVTRVPVLLPFIMSYFLIGTKMIWPLLVEHLPWLATIRQI